VDSEEGQSKTPVGLIRGDSGVGILEWWLESCFQLLSY